MMKYDEYRQNDEAQISDLINESPTAKLITMGEDGPNVGIFNPVKTDDRFLLHLNRQDSQIEDLEKNPTAALVFFQFLANIPSYWVDPKYGGAATSYYRFAQFNCQTRVYTTPEQVREACQKVILHYQPEGQHLPLSHKIYASSYAELAIVELIPRHVQTKWKLGQNRPQGIRRQIIERLKIRGLPNDHLAGRELEKWIANEPMTSAFQPI